MSEPRLHVVFIHPGAIEALGEAIKPYLSEGAYGKHIVCREIDSGGAFFAMTIEGTTGEGRRVELQVMIPANMVQMVVSSQGEATFGFQAGYQPPVTPPAKHEPSVSAAGGRAAVVPPSASQVTEEGSGQPPIEG